MNYSNLKKGDKITIQYQYYEIGGFKTMTQNAEIDSIDRHGIFTVDGHWHGLYTIDKIWFTQEVFLGKE